MKTCPRCGATYHDRVSFCFEDGGVLEADAATAPASSGAVKAPPRTVATPIPVPRRGRSLLSRNRPAARRAPRPVPETPPAVRIQPLTPLDVQPPDEVPLTADEAPAPATPPAPGPREATPEPVVYELPPPEPPPEDSPAPPPPEPGSADLDAEEIEEDRGGLVISLATMGAVFAVLAVVFGGAALWILLSDDGSGELAVATPPAAPAAPAPAAEVPTQPAPPPETTGSAAPPAETTGRQASGAEADPEPGGIGSDGAEGSGSDTVVPRPEDGEPAPAAEPRGAAATPPPAPEEPPAAPGSEEAPIHTPPPADPAPVGPVHSPWTEEEDPEPAPPAANATLVVETTPPGADIYVNGVNMGVAPFTLTMPFGRYAVEARLGGHIPATQIVELRNAAGETVRLDLEPEARTGALLVTLAGWAGASLSVDGRPVGNLPARIDAITEGEHRFVVEGDNGRREIRRVVRLSGSGLTVLELGS